MCYILSLGRCSRWLAPCVITSSHWAAAAGAETRPWLLASRTAAHLPLNVGTLAQPREGLVQHRNQHLIQCLKELPACHKHSRAALAQHLKFKELPKAQVQMKEPASFAPTQMHEVSLKPSLGSHSE